MKYSFTEKKRIRKDFGKRQSVLEVPYLLETTAGKILTGLVVEQTDEQVVLQDAKNKLQKIPANEVELLVRQRKSLMPELLLRDMTRQEVADLLAYLSALK